MMWTFFAAGAAFVVIGGLAVALYRQWRQSRSLQAQLQAAAADLEHLQRACARLAPGSLWRG